MQGAFALCPDGVQHPKVAVGEGVEHLNREHGGRLWSSVLAFSGDRDVTDDAVAEAFAQALRRGPALRDPLAWIWKVAFRLAAGELKRRRSLSAVMSDVGKETDVIDGRVLAAVRLLPERQRAAVALHYYADLSVQESARIMDTRPMTVGVHLHRAHKRLRDLLGDDVA